jgi:hypothetical protein
MLLSKVPEHAYNCQCCLNYFGLVLLFSLFFRVGFYLFHVCCLVAVALSDPKYLQLYYWVISYFFSG